MALFQGLPRSAGTRKVKPIWILLKQQTVSDSGISRAICKSASRSRQITTPVPHRSLQAGCNSCRQTSSVKALKYKTFNNITVCVLLMRIFTSAKLLNHAMKRSGLVYWRSEVNNKTTGINEQTAKAKAKYPMLRLRPKIDGSKSHYTPMHVFLASELLFAGKELTTML